MVLLDIIVSLFSKKFYHFRIIIYISVEPIYLHISIMILVKAKRYDYVILKIILRTIFFRQMYDVIPIKLFVLIKIVSSRFEYLPE